MKVIVISWMYPHEMPNNSDNRPKSIERISTTIDDVKEYMKTSSCSFGKYLEWADNLSNLVLRDQGEHILYDDIEEFYGCNGYNYLQECLENDSLGQCVARMYNNEEEKAEDAHYFLFQVRNPLI